MINLGLVGFPLEHSLSPMLHEAALLALGLPGDYSLYPIGAGDTAALARLINHVRRGDIMGLNVTIPHKQTVIPLLDALTSSAEKIGAVNTIYARDGKVIGDNTDAPGFISDLDRFISVPASALVLGAGGAAHAAVFALWSRHWSVSVAARKIEQAQRLARRFPGVGAIPLNVETLAKSRADLVVNATSVGMFPHIDESPWPMRLDLPDGAIIYDLVYNPAETKLVQRGQVAGLRATTGLGMLVEQAALAFEIWTGYRVQREILWGALAQRVR